MNPSLIAATTAATASRPPTREEQIDQAAREYSTNEQAREHFREGAKWSDGPDEPLTLGLFVFLVVFLITAFYVVTFFVGVLDAPRPTAYERNDVCLETRFDYVVWPALCAGREAGKWLKSPVGGGE